MAKRRTRKPVQKVWPYRANWRFGILNHVGQIWTPRTFDSEAEGKEFISGYQAANKASDLRRHKVVPVNVTVSVKRPSRSRKETR
jgi:hypothetical protein